MPGVADPPALVGVSLERDRAHAVVLRGQDVVLALHEDGPDPSGLLARCLAACPAPASVVVDISRVLSALVMHAPSALSRVTAVRVVPRAATDAALVRHPADVVERLVARRFTVPGGHDLLGQELQPLDRPALTEVLRALQAEPPESVAVVAAGSQAQPRHEREVADALHMALPRTRIAVAGDVGGQGLVAREATVVLDSALGRAAAEVLDRCEFALARSVAGAPLRVARGDGGWVSASRARALPVLALGASAALQVLGAAALAGADTCRVVLPGPQGPVGGHVRNHLVAVRPHVLGGLGTELVVPAATLNRSAAVGRASDVGPWRAGDVPVVVADRDVDELVCVGAAVSRPMAWLDEIAVFESSAELDGVRRDAVARATARVTANGADPGSADIVEVSTVAMPYSQSGTVRIRVRVAGRSEHRVGAAA